MKKEKIRQALGIALVVSPLLAIICLGVLKSENPLREVLIALGIAMVVGVPVIVGIILITSTWGKR